VSMVIETYLRIRKGLLLRYSVWNWSPRIGIVIR